MGHCMICNLKLLNANVVYTRFTLSGIEKVLDMIRPGDFFGSLDLVTAYGHAYIDSRYQKFFQFQWRHRHFKYVSLPQGYADSLRLFTRLTVPIVAELHKRFIDVLLFIDDSFVRAESAAKLNDNIKTAVHLFCTVASK